MTVKYLMGSSEVVSLINRFGHAISYSELLNLEQQGIILPSNIKPNVFTTFCWDNNDLYKQTLSDSGTLLKWNIFSTMNALLCTTSSSDHVI